MGEKKRILIVSHALELGGAERSLIGLLHALSPQRCQVDLFLLRHEGELMGDIPPHIRLLPEVAAYTVLARPMKDTLREGHLLLTAARVFGKLAAGVYSRRHRYTESMVALEYSHKYTCPFMPAIQPEVEYDLAISFLTPHYFVWKKVRARKKAAWIHTDYEAIQIDTASEEKMWSAYDAIVSISEQCTRGFLSRFPALCSKIVRIDHMLAPAWIRAQADKCDVSGEMCRGVEKLLSVGRFCHAKNFDNVPDICRRLRALGRDVHWYLIGFGGDEELIRSKITEAGMEEHVTILGKRENPYPYMKACDLYVQPSRYEGNCVCVHEAQILGKPVVIADYATSASQLRDGVDGIIVPMDNEGCAQGIATVLADEALRKRIVAGGWQAGTPDQTALEILYRLSGD
ncbi:glycosyltransferase [Flavonifractor hominis]|uniref:Glycosyltransferase n=1 Tax=Flavonifractor hominis TaxID=3133178 RepID=A0ABV1EMJ8_9FIRM